MSELLRYIPDEVGRNASDVGLKWVFHKPWPLSGLRYYILFIHSFICSFDKCLLSPSAPGTVVGMFSKGQGCDRGFGFQCTRQSFSTKLLVSNVLTIKSEYRRADAGSLETDRTRVPGQSPLFVRCGTFSNCLTPSRLSLSILEMVLMTVRVFQGESEQ